MGAVVFQDLENDAYHWHKAISRSGIVEFMRSPSNFWNAYHNENRPKKVTTEAMMFGSAFHSLVLEPEKFSKEYAMKPEGIDRRTKQGKADYEEFEARSAGKTIITKEQLDTLRAMQQSVFKHPQAGALVCNARYEHSIFWDDENTGMELKTRPDAWHENMTVDLKTIASADPRSFQNAMVAHGYHIQSAMMREGIRAATGKDITNHLFVCVEKTFPFLVAVYILDETTLEVGHSTIRRVLSEMKFCYDTNEWPGYETQTLGLPNWAVNL